VALGFSDQACSSTGKCDSALEDAQSERVEAVVFGDCLLAFHLSTVIPRAGVGDPFAGPGELRHNNVVKKTAIILNPTSPVEASKNEDESTREWVARSVLENGPSTAVVLGERLGLTPAGIRRHLDTLVSQGILEAREPRLIIRGRGRPAKVFVVTDAGRAHFAQSYDDLAAAALRYLRIQGGVAALEGFAQSRAIDLERRISLSHLEVEARLPALVEALSAEGYAASAAALGNGDQLCQHHCPVAHVAAEFPEICEAETAALSRILGSHVQRLATIAHGDGVCTTYIPAPLTIRTPSEIK